MKYKGIELVPITEEQILDHDKEYAFWDDGASTCNIQPGGCIVTRESTQGKSKLVNYTLFGMGYNNCAELPQSTMRDRTGLEVIEYVHNLQNLFIGRVITAFPLPKGIDDIGWRNRMVVFNCYDSYGWSGIGSLSELRPYDAKGEARYGILHDGKVTEFEIPQIEVKS